MPDTFSNRLRMAMDLRELRQADLIVKAKPLCQEVGVKLESNAISQYLAGKVMPREDKLRILSQVLDVNQLWLAGQDVPWSRTPDEHETDRLINQVSIMDNANNKILMNADVRRTAILYYRADDVTKELSRRVLEKFREISDSDATGYYNYEDVYAQQDALDTAD